MNPELQPFLLELCYLATLRNNINIKRHRARYRKNYYAKAIRVVEAHNNSNYELRALRENVDLLKRHNNYKTQLAQWRRRINIIEREMTELVAKNPKPKKWQDMGLHKLRSLMLLGEGEYAMAKHETMEFSIKSRARVKFLLDRLECHTHYDNGSIITIEFPMVKVISSAEIKTLSDQYELNKAIEDTLQE